MAYEQKPNWGTLWPNDYKKQDIHPDVKGDIFIERELLETLLANNPTGLIKMSIGGWAGKVVNKKVLNVQASLPREGGSERAPSKPLDDNDLPY